MVCLLEYGGIVGGDAERASRYLLRKHVRPHDFSTYADLCCFRETRFAQTVTPAAKLSISKNGGNATCWKGKERSFDGWRLLLKKYSILPISKREEFVFSFLFIYSLFNAKKYYKNIKKRCANITKYT